MYNRGVAAAQRGDYETAIREWRPLARQGNAEAQNMLGFMYQEGTGVPKNAKTAVKWYRLAAEQGDENTQLGLGVMYFVGEGVKKRDFLYAHMWGNISASLGVKEGAELRDMAATEMTPAHISKAQDLARECVRKKYKGC